jgi:hypothetical protein
LGGVQCPVSWQRLSSELVTRDRELPLPNSFSSTNSHLILIIDHGRTQLESSGTKGLYFFHFSLGGLVVTTHPNSINRLFQTEDEHDPHFEPVIKLTEEVETKTNEENETIVFKLYVSFSTDSNWIKKFLDNPLITPPPPPLTCHAGVQSSSDLIFLQTNGKSVGQVRRDCYSTRKHTRFALLCGAKRRSKCAPTILVRHPSHPNPVT